MMQYFRRPSIAGKNLPRVQFAKIRGSIRRNDADAIYSYPYFPDLVLGTNLELKVGTHSLGTFTFSVLVNHNGISDIIDDINAVTLPYAMAIEEDGAISIKNMEIGADCFINLMSGTAAAALGFDLSLGPVCSFSGEIEGTPHGRVGNQNGVAFVNTGENLNASSVQRATARLADNSDVLYADLQKQRPTLQKVSSYTVSSGRNYITPEPSTRLFTGGPSASNVGSNLTASSTKEDLAAHYVLIDTITKQPAASRVVAVTRGVPAGAPPFTSATSWYPPFAVGNVLGTLIRKDSDPLGILINDIKYGRVVELYAPLDSSVVEGDLVEIHDATNLARGSNNGLRWVLERIVDSTHIVLRPMSSSELVQAGQDLLDSQAKVDLNDHKEMPEAWGYARFFAGPFTTNVNLFVDPPLPPNSNYELWASQPVSDREELTWQKPQSQTLTRGHFTNDLDTSKNVLLSAPAISHDSTTVTIGGYYARWHGRTVYVPQATFTPPVPNTKTVYYWDEKLVRTGQVDSVDFPDSLFNKDIYPDPSLSSSASGGEKGIPLAVVDTDSSSVIYAKSVARVEGAGHTVTVGWSGDFPDLPSALRYVNVLSRLANNELNQAEGNYPHFTIVLLNDQDVDTASAVTELAIATPSLTIKGATPSVKLNFVGPGGTYLFGKASLNLAYKLVLEDLVLRVSTSSPVVLARSFSSLVMRNVFQDLTGRPFSVVASYPGPGARVLMSWCSLYLAGGIVQDINNADVDIVLRDSYFYYGSLSGVQTQLISSAYGPSAQLFLGGFLADNCRFIDFPAVTTDPVLLYGASSSNAEICVQGCYFSFNTDSPPVSGSTILRGAKTKMVRCVVDGKGGAAPISRVILSGTYGIVDSCSIEVKPESSYLTSIAVASITGSSVVCYESVSGTNGTAIWATRLASGNRISGPFGAGIICAGLSGSVSSVIGNDIRLEEGPNTKPAGGVFAYSGARIVGNSIYLNSSFSGRSCILVHTGESDVAVSDNVISASGDDCAGILVTGNHGLSITGNSIELSSAGVLSNGIYCVVPDGNIIASNNIRVTNVDSQPIGKSINVTGPGDFSYSVVGNMLVGNVSLGASSSFSKFESNTATGSLSVGMCLVSGNILNGDVVLTSNCDVKDNILNGKLDGSVSGVAHNILGNTIAQTVTLLDPSATNEIRFEGNGLSDITTIRGAKTYFSKNRSYGSKLVRVLLDEGSVSENVFNGPSQINRIAAIDQSGRITVAENSFVGDCIASTVNSFCENRCQGDVTVSGTDLFVAAFSGNTINATVPVSLAKCSGSGNNIVSYGMDLNTCRLSDGLLAESALSTYGINLVNCKLVSMRVQPHHINASGGSITLEECEILCSAPTGPQLCTISATQVLFNSVKATSEVGTINSWLFTSNNIDLKSCYFAGNVSTPSGAHILSADTVVFTSLDLSGLVKFSMNNLIGLSPGTVNITAASGDVSGSLSNSTLTSLSIAGSGGSCSVENCKLGSDVHITGFSDCHLTNVNCNNITADGFPVVDGCHIAGNLFLTETKSNHLAAVSSTIIGGDILSSSPANGILTGLKMRDSRANVLYSESAYKLTISGCNLKKFVSFGTIADFYVAGCQFIDSGNESGILATSGAIDAVVRDSSLNSIMLVGKVHHVMISNNDIDGSYSAEHLPIQVVDGSEDSSVSISNNRIKTHGASSPIELYRPRHPGDPLGPPVILDTYGSSCGCIVIGENMIKHNTSSIIFGKVSIIGNHLSDAHGTYHFIDMIRISARVLSGSVIGNVMECSPTPLGVENLIPYVNSFFRTQASDEGDEDSQSNNIAFSGNVFQTHGGIIDLNQNVFISLVGWQPGAFPPGQEPPRIAVGGGGNGLLCVFETYPTNSVIVPYRPLLAPLPSPDNCYAIFIPIPPV